MKQYKHRTLIWCGLYRFLHYGNIRKYRAIRVTGGGRKRKWCNGTVAGAGIFAFFFLFSLTLWQVIPLSHMRAEGSKTGQFDIITMGKYMYLYLWSWRRCQ